MARAKTVAAALKYYCSELDNWRSFEAQMDFVEECNPCLLDVIHDNFATYEPRISRFDLPIEDMFPFLDRDEFKAQMIIDPMEGWEKNK